MLCDRFDVELYKYVGGERRWGLLEDGGFLWLPQKYSQKGVLRVNPKTC